MLLTVSTTILEAQEKSSFGFYTDRDVYVSGETLLAKVFTPELNNSTMVYMDLVGPFG